MRKRDYSEEEKYAVYLEGRKAPSKTYKDLEPAEVEAIRLTAEYRIKAYVVKLVSMFKAPSDQEIADSRRQKQDIENKIARKLANGNTR